MTDRINIRSALFYAVDNCSVQTFSDVCALSNGRLRELVIKICHLAYTAF